MSLIIFVRSIVHDARVRTELQEPYSLAKSAIGLSPCAASPGPVSTRFEVRGGVTTYHAFHACSAGAARFFMLPGPAPGYTSRWTAHTPSRGAGLPDIVYSC